MRFTRGRGTTGEREVSPQRILHYRENWYLLAWCHQANDLRLFAFDAVRHAESLRAAARKVPASRLDRMIGDGFGIFGGRSNARAILRFSPLAARWVVDEVQPHRDIDITWRPISLLFKNEPVFEAVATTGDGVLETLKAIARQVLVELRKSA